MATLIRGEQLDLTDVLNDLESGLDNLYVRRDGSTLMTGALNLNGNTIDMGLNSITDTKVGQWDIAFGWGDHGAVGYLTSFTETDPVFTASDVAGVTTADISNWDTAFGWGDHAGLYATPAQGALADSAMQDLSDDGSPQLGGHLDIQNEYIYSSTGDTRIQYPTLHTGAGIGGSVKLTGQQGTGATSWGGFVQIRGGSSTNVAGGNVELQGGTGGLDGGDVRIDGGGGSSGSGGDILLRPGYNTTSNTNAGSVIVQGGTNSPAIVMEFKELVANGPDFVGLKAPDDITGGSRTWTLPQDDPATVNGQFLTTDASGNLSFAPGGASAWTFESTGNAVPATTGSTAYAHGLGSIPTEAQFVLVCATANNGYSVGDEFHISHSAELDGVVLGLATDATNVYLLKNSASLRIVSRTTGGPTTPTLSHWTLTVRAR